MLRYFSCLVSYYIVQPSQVMHGGLFSEDGVTLEDLRKIERNRQPPDSGRAKLLV